MELVNNDIAIRADCGNPTIEALLRRTSEPITPEMVDARLEAFGISEGPELVDDSLEDSPEHDAKVELLITENTLPVAETKRTILDRLVKDEKGEARPVLGAIAVGAVVIIVGYQAIFNGAKPTAEDKKSEKALFKGTPTPTPEVSPSVSPSPELQTQNFLKDIEEKFPDMKIGEDLLLGEAVDHTKNPKEAGPGAFSKEVLTSQDDISGFLTEDNKSERAIKAQERVFGALKDRPDAQEEIARAKSGEAYFPVQITKKAKIYGTTFVNSKGEVQQMKTGRSVEAGDVMWLFVDTEGHIIPGASLRADCDNPDFIVIMLLKPGEKVPPIECEQECEEKPKKEKTCEERGDCRPCVNCKTVTPKKDKGIPFNPADGPKGLDKGTPSLGGEGKGPSGQMPATDGYVTGEQRPATPATTGTGNIGPKPPSSVTENRPPAVTGTDLGPNQPSAPVPGTSNTVNQGNNVNLDDL